MAVTLLAKWRRRRRAPSRVSLVLSRAFFPSTYVVFSYGGDAAMLDAFQGAVSNFASTVPM